jgi:putative ABC transport system permease protein
MVIYLRLLRESFNFAISALVNNKLRTFLSLLGVTIGIFSIIGILAAVDSLKKEVQGSFSGLDNSTLIVAHYSFGPTTVPRWRREQFPAVKYEEYQYLVRNLPDAEAVTYGMNVPPETIRFEEKTVSNVQIGAITHEYYQIEALQLARGRFFNEAESNSGSQVIVLGDEIARNLFGDADPIGKIVRMYGQRFAVIGVLKKEGAGLFGNSKDSAVFLPVNVARRIFGSDNRNSFPQIVIKPNKGVDQDEFISTVKQRLRASRGTRPDDIDTFFINELKGFSEMIDNLSTQLNFMGLIISAFSLLVGGFGIANIMFVSVRERTNLIGIQKSLGAKNKFILAQFLFEAVILAVIGGLIGLFLVWLASVLASMFTGDFQFVVSFTNLMIGTVISGLIGLVSGIIPAISASRLDPVEAIRTGM